MSKDKGSTSTSIGAQIMALPDRVDSARAVAADWRRDTAASIQTHPLRALLIAFGVGVVISKLGRYV